MTMCSAVIVNRRGNQASKVFFGLVLLMLMIVVSAQDYREANPTVEQTDKRYYDNVMKQSQMKAAPTIWDLIVNVNMARYGKHPSKADCICTTKADAPNARSWNVPTFPTGDPAPAATFLELEQRITAAKEMLKQRAIQENQAKASEAMNDRTTGTPGHISWSWSDEGGVAVHKDFDKAMEEMGEDLLAVHERTVVEHSNYPDLIAEESAGALSNDDIVMRYHLLDQRMNDAGHKMDHDLNT